MERLNHSDAKQRPKMKLDLDEFDLENYELGPLTQGLGLHSVKKKKSVAQFSPKRTETALNQISASTQQNNLYPQVPLKKLSEMRHTKPLEPTLVRRHPQQQVFHSSFSDHKRLNKTRELQENKLREVGEVDQFCAFFIDVVVLLGVYSGMIMAFTLIAGIPYEWKVLRVFWFQFWPYFSLLGISIFLFYFTLLDSGGTPGKRIIGLRSVGTKDFKTTNLQQNFCRSFVTLLSFILFGLPFLVDFQGKASHTKLVKV